jgi:hypothetical protein
VNEHLLLASRTALRRSALYKRWLRDSPGEAERVNRYWDTGNGYPNAVSPFGLAYALNGQAYHMAAAPLPYPLGDPRDG